MHHWPSQDTYTQHKANMLYQTYRDLRVKKWKKYCIQMEMEKKKAGVTILIIKQKRLYNKTYYKKNISYTITKIGMNPNCP